MEADHVGACEQVVKLAPFDRYSGRQGPMKRIVGQNLHPEGVRELGRALADPAQADDAHRLSRQLDQRRLADRKIGLVCPFECPDGLIVKADVVAQLQQQGEDVLGDRACAVDRHVRDRNTALRAAAISTQSKPVAVTATNRRTGDSLIKSARIGALFVIRISAPLARERTSSAELAW